MERAEWLKQMRSKAEALYDHFSPRYWVKWGLEVEETHRAYLQKFLSRVAPGSAVLSAGCGAGLYEGLLLEEGLSVTGIDQSAGMLALAREHFPQVRYEKMGLQEMPFREEFDGVICMDAMEHICPEDYPAILCGFSQALKPGGVLYFTVDNSEPEEQLEASYQRAKALGLPVVYGEVADEVDSNYAQLIVMDPNQPLPGDLADRAVYHFHPSLDQVRQWLGQAGAIIEEEGDGLWYHHFVARKK